MSKDKKKFQLEQSKVFCMLPWVHLHFLPDGGAHACCLSDSTKPFGNFSETPSIVELWNSEKAKELRSNMIADKPSALCGRCYELEDHGVYTLRKMANESFGKDWESKIPATKKDGEIKDPKMKYLDVRFSNICNFKCQTCGPQFSSSWHDDQKAMYPGYVGKKLTRVDPSEEFMAQLKPMLLETEKVYFAGGEPIITEEIYEVLEHWIEKKKFDVEVAFTTNFSVIKFGKKNILDYWKLFKNVRISASLDDSGPRAEYLRKGTIWKNIENNRQEMLKVCPEIYFEITPTISIFNVWHFPDFHRDWIDRGLLKPNNLRLNILTFPREMSVALISIKKRKKIIEKWKKAKSEIVELSKKFHEGSHNIEMGYDSIIHCLETEPELSELRLDLFRRLSMLAKVRNESLDLVYPEFEKIYDLPNLDGMNGKLT